MRKNGLAMAATISAMLMVTAPAAAQEAVDTSYGNPQPQEDRGFPWGLLGLLGLAGLLPRKTRHVQDNDNRAKR